MGPRGDRPEPTRQEPIPATAFGPANPTAPGERRAVVHVLADMAMTINDRRSA